MAIRLGTVAPIGFQQFPPEEWLGCFRKLGCQVVQAYRDPQAELTLQEIKDAIAAGQMPCDSLHAVYGEQFDPSSPSESARRAALNALKAEGEMALALGGPLVVVHCATIRPEGISREEHGLRVAQLERSIVELGEFGGSLGVRYAFENLPGYHAVGYNVGELAGILSRLNAPNTGMCFDTGHANMVGDVADAVRRTNGQMIYVHLSDNSGKADQHDMPTYGTMDSQAVAQALCDEHYRGTIMLEVFHGLDRLKQLIDDGCAERLARIIRTAQGKASD